MNVRTRDNKVHGEFTLEAVSAKFTELATERIKLLKLEVDTETIKAAICESKLRIKAANCVIAGASIIKIKPSTATTKNTSLYYQLQYLRDKLPEVVVKGILVPDTFTTTSTGPLGS